MRRSRILLRVLPAMAVLAIAIGAHLSVRPTATTERGSHPAASASASRIEAPLVRVKAFDAHQQRADTEGRRVDLGILAGTCALAIAVLLSIIGRSRIPRDGTASASGTRVRAPPACASGTTGRVALV